MTDPIPAGFLAGRAAASLVRSRASESRIPYDEVRGRALAAPPAPRLVRTDFTLIAEVKLAAPSRPGELSRRSVGTQVGAYVAGGASAISVLTEPEHFAGSLAHLAEASAFAGHVPVLRKDFLVTPYQVFEARTHGAAGVLLIAAILDDDQLDAMLDAAREAGMFVLLEAFDADELQRAARHADDDVLVGLNCRDLRTLQVDAGRFEALAEPARALGAVAESGLRDAGDVEAVARLGYRGALVGTSLMEVDDPEAAVRAMVAAGRRASCALA